MDKNLSRHYFRTDYGGREDDEDESEGDMSHRAKQKYNKERKKVSMGREEMTMKHLQKFNEDEDEMVDQQKRTGKLRRGSDL